MLEQAYKEQGAELKDAQEQLDFANQEIFNLRMKYSLLEKNYGRSSVTTPQNMDASFQYTDYDHVDENLGGTQVIGKRRKSVGASSKKKSKK